MLQHHSTMDSVVTLPVLQYHYIIHTLVHLNFVYRSVTTVSIPLCHLIDDIVVPLHYPCFSEITLLIVSLHCLCCSITTLYIALHRSYCLLLHYQSYCVIRLSTMTFVILPLYHLGHPFLLCCYILGFYTVFYTERQR